jgi:hypothetical protein
VQLPIPEALRPGEAGSSGLAVDLGFNVWDLYEFWQDGDAGGVVLSVVGTGLAEGAAASFITHTAGLGGTRLTVTAAELAFMLTAQDPPRRSPAWRMLGLTPAERAPVALSAGLGSLLVRGLAAASDQVQLAPDAGAVADGLGTPRIWAQLGLVSDTVQDGTLLFESASARFLVAPRAHRCFEVIGLDPARPLTELLLHVVQTFLEQYRPAVTSIIVTTTGSVAAGLGERSFILAIGPDGAWSWGVDPTPDVVEQDLTRAEAVERFERELVAFLPVSAP